jgi:hypothetical protein
MSLELYAENNAGTIVHVPSRLRADSLEVTIQAAEGSVGSSVIELDDPTGDFYMRGLKPLYFIETDAQADDWNGIIGPFYAWNRQVSRGEFSRTSNSRVWRVNVNDINTLLTRRLQKGGDAERRAETDVERMDWLTNTAEVIGGGGDNGFSIEDFTYFFEDSPYPMDKTDYTGQDSTGVINDCLQDSGKNAFLFNSPIDGEPIRVGIWYGRTERSDFASAHRISNILSDVNADPAEMPFTLTETEMLEGTWTPRPSTPSSTVIRRASPRASWSSTTAATATRHAPPRRRRSRGGTCSCRRSWSRPARRRHGARTATCATSATRTTPSSAR